MLKASTLRRIAEVLLLTVLFQAFLVTGAVAGPARQNGAFPGQICSVSGLGLSGSDISKPGPNPSAPADNQGHLQGHCALCGALTADLPSSGLPDVPKVPFTQPQPDVSRAASPAFADLPLPFSRAPPFAFL
jgi:hypothetical protein